MIVFLCPPAVTYDNAVSKLAAEEEAQDGEEDQEDDDGGGGGEEEGKKAYHYHSHSQLHLTRSDASTPQPLAPSGMYEMSVTSC